MKKLEVRKNTYYDSVTLMIISKEVKTVDGVNEALVGMGTDLRYGHRPEPGAGKDPAPGVPRL